MATTTKSRLANIAIGIMIGFLAGALIGHILTPYRGPYEAPDINPKGIEMAEMRTLTEQRYLWLLDGCPEPPIAGHYIYNYSNEERTNYTYSNTITEPGQTLNGEKLKDLTYPGLFATKRKDWDYTLVIATTG